MRPHIGVLVYFWVSYMSPHRLSWGFAYNMPFAQVITVATILAIIFSKEKKRIPMSPVVAVWIIFLLWISLTTLFAEFPELANEQFIKVMKVQLLIFITMMVINTKERIIQLVWVIFLSIGFYGIKGGIFGILTAGSYRIWGPGGSFIEDNNELALALLVIFPLIFFLRSVSTNKWVKRGLMASAPLIAVSVVASYSRGAFLAGLCMVVFLGLKSKRKVMVGVLLAISVVMLGVFMPQQWHERMGTVQEFEQDESALGRIDSWMFAVDIASDRPLGAGMGMWGKSALFSQ
ncbi:MAG: putative O-glycosylation ligase, exosortase A system-associated, partial [Gammaproteobacteria bacterium]|nr:putative O-glycosylation ligase, exosortase A system-associated [Gammaproteobacteria bacterium]